MSAWKSAQLACREAGISEQSFYRWRKEYGGLDLDQARKMKDLEKENVRLKRLVSAPISRCRVLRANVSRIGGLTTPLTLKQQAQAFLRWRKAQGGAVAKKRRPPWYFHQWRKGGK